MKIIWSLVFLMFFSPYIAAAEPLLFDNLPAAYVGSFKWDRGGDVHQVVFILERQHKNKEGKITMQGKGIYGAIEKTNTNVKALIDPATYEIEIWESLDKEGDFITGGSHVGNISPDLKVIETIWATSGDKGHLQLIRKESHSY